MNQVFKLGTIALLLSTLSACSSLWPWGKDKCDDGFCDETATISNEATQEAWYCYGVQVDRSWDCVNKPNPGKIVAVDPRLVQPKARSTTGNELQLSSVPDKQEILTAINGKKSASQRILSKPSEHFAVQIFAVRDEDKLQAFAGQHSINDPLYVRMESRKKIWYVLLLDTYSTKAKAESAMADWTDQRNLVVRPWVRELESLQEAIRLALEG